MSQSFRPGADASHIFAEPPIVWQPYDGLRHGYRAPRHPFGDRIIALCGSEIVSYQPSKSEQLWLTCVDCHHFAHLLVNAPS